MLRVQWIGNWKPEFKFHPLLLAFYVAMVTSMPSLAQFSLLWNGGLPARYMDLTCIVLCESAYGHWKNVIPILKMKEFGYRKSLWKKKFFYLFIRVCLFVLCVYTHMLFGLLCAAVCDLTTAACSVSDYLVVESKFSGQILVNWTVIKWNAHVCSNVLYFYAIQNAYQISIGNRLKLAVFK